MHHQQQEGVLSDCGIVPENLNECLKPWKSAWNPSEVTQVGRTSEKCKTCLKVLILSFLVPKFSSWWRFFLATVVLLDSCLVWRKELPFLHIYWQSCFILAWRFVDHWTLEWSYHRESNLQNLQNRKWVEFIHFSNLFWIQCIKKEIPQFYLNTKNNLNFEDIKNNPNSLTQFLMIPTLLPSPHCNPEGVLCNEIAEINTILFC